MKLSPSQTTQERVSNALKRAEDRAVKKAARSVDLAVHTNFFKKLGGGDIHLRGILQDALKHHDRAQERVSRPSTRMTAPDTGGRPFHFELKTVSKAKIAARNGNAAQGTGTKSRGKTRSVSASHIVYIEREGAIEQGQDPTTTANRPSSADLQAYLENEHKVRANLIGDDEGQSGAFSFGTPGMGSTLQERMAFWDLVEQHATPHETLQRRLILELPHECSAADRLAIMQSFTSQYEAESIPFWCCLHAPIAGKNDPRNFHAHIVLANRPAWKQPFPEGGRSDKRPDGPLIDTWTFAARHEWTDKHRKLRVDYPLVPDLSEKRRTFVRDERKRFAEAVNEQMRRSGINVRYDARSYRDMGISKEAIEARAQAAYERAEATSPPPRKRGPWKRVGIEVAVARKYAGIITRIEGIRHAAHRGLKALADLERKTPILDRRPLPLHASHALRKEYEKAALRYARTLDEDVTTNIRCEIQGLELRRHVDATHPATAFGHGLRKRNQAPSRVNNPNDLDGSFPVGTTPALPRIEVGLIPARPQAEHQPVDDGQLLALIREALIAEAETLEVEASAAKARSSHRVSKSLTAWRKVAARPAPVELPRFTEHVINAPWKEQPPHPLLRHYDPHAHAMISKMFKTPISRLALELTNQMTDFFKQVVEIEGKSKGEAVMELARRLADAFHRDPHEGIQALAMGPQAFVEAGFRADETVILSNSHKKKLRKQAELRQTAIIGLESKPFGEAVRPASDLKEMSANRDESRSLAIPDTDPVDQQANRAVDPIEPGDSRSESPKSDVISPTQHVPIGSGLSSPKAADTDLVAPTPPPAGQALTNVLPTETIDENDDQAPEPGGKPTTKSKPKRRRAPRRDTGWER